MRVPGVKSVAISGWPLLGRIRDQQRYLDQWCASQPDACVVPECFSGLALDDEDPARFRPRLSRGDTSPGAAIVNETFVKTFFPGQDPIGRTFERGVNQPVNKIVGVTRDVPYHDLREPSRACLLHSH